MAASILFLTVQEAYKDAMDEIDSRRSDVNYQSSRRRQTALMIFAIDYVNGGPTELFRKLLVAGADMTIQDYAGNTVLHYCLYHPRLIRILRYFGVDLNMEDLFGQHVGRLALTIRNRESLLAIYGAMPTTPNGDYGSDPRFDDYSDGTADASLQALYKIVKSSHAFGRPPNQDGHVLADDDYKPIQRLVKEINEGNLEADEYLNPTTEYVIQPIVEQAIFKGESYDTALREALYDDLDPSGTEMVIDAAAKAFAFWLTVARVIFVRKWPSTKRTKKSSPFQ